MTAESDLTSVRSYINSLISLEQSSWFDEQIQVYMEEHSDLDDEYDIRYIATSTLRATIQHQIYRYIQ